MIGKMGASEIAAVGIANQVFFLVMMIIFGINSGISVYVAQFWGRKDTKNIKKTMGVSLSFGSLVGLIFSILAYVFPEQIMKLFVEDVKVIALGVDYLKIIAWSYVFTAISFSFQIASRGIGKTLQPMIVSAIALSANAFLNYVLIFGAFGMPALGVKGAAIGTLLARIIEVVLMVALIYGGKSILAASIRDLFGFNGKFVRQIFRRAGPVLLNEIFWSLGTIMYMWSVGNLGGEAVASYQITTTIYRFYEIIFIGFASAAGVMIGNQIGGNAEDQAIEISRQVVKLSFLLSIFVSIAMYFLGPFIINQFNVGLLVSENARKLFNIYCVYGIARVFNLMMVVGILRGGGDTRYAMLMELSCVWLVGVPLAVVSSVLLNLSVVYVVWLFSTEELVKVIGNYRRFKSKKWVHNVISTMD
jgi:putative MATE family efflux protein